MCYLFRILEKKIIKFVKSLKSKKRVKMIVINSISDKYFELNGVNHAKIYQPLKKSLDSFGLYNVYTGENIVAVSSYEEFIVDGVVYSTLNEAINSVLNTTYFVFSSDLKNDLLSKLDKGGYLGNAQDLHDSIVASANGINAFDSLGEANTFYDSNSITEKEIFVVSVGSERGYYTRLLNGENRFDRAFLDEVAINDLNIKLLKSRISIDENGSFLNSSGSLNVFEGAVVSRFFDCKEGDIILYTGRFGQAGVACNFYDENGVVLESETYTSQIEVEDLRIIAPVNAVKARASSLNQKLLIQLLDDTNKEIVFDTLRNDFLLNNGNVKITVSNLFYRTDGNFQGFNGCSSSKIYPYKQGDKYIYSGSYGSAAVACNFRNELGVIIGSVTNSSVINVESIIIEPIEGTYFVEFSSLSSVFNIQVISNYTEGVNLLKQNAFLESINAPIQVANKFLRNNDIESNFPEAIGISSNIVISEGEVLFYTGRFGQAAVAGNFYDENDNIIKSYNNTGEQIEGLDFVMIAPPNTSYVRLSSLSSVLSYRKMSITEQLSFFKSKIDVNYFGKDLVGIGDSMMFGHTTDTDKTWFFKLAQEMQMQGINLGVNGRSISTATHTAMASDDYVNLIPLTTKYLLVHCGTNDISVNVDLGDSDSTDIDTFNGAVNLFLDKVQTRVPNCKIGWITPYNRVNTNTITYVEALKERCKEFGVPVFDNTEKAGFNWNNTNQANLLTLGDGVHLNDEGHSFEVTKYKEFLKTL